MADILLRCSKASANLYYSIFKLLTSLHTTSSFEMIAVVSPRSWRSWSLYYRPSSRSVLLEGIAERFPVNRNPDICGWSWDLILLCVASTFLGVLISVFLKVASLLLKPSMSLLSSFASSWYYMSKLGAYLLLIFLYLFSPSLRSMLRLLSSMKDEASSVFCLLVFGLAFCCDGLSICDKDGSSGTLC